MKINRSKKYQRRRLALLMIIVVVPILIVIGMHKSTDATPITVHDVHVMSTTTHTVDMPAVTVDKTVVATTTTVDKEDDATILARLIQSEADGESYAGKLAVGTVVMNRLAIGRWGHTIYSVISAKGQFDGYDNPLYWQDVHTDNLKAAHAVLDGHRSFNSNILYYYDPITATDVKFMSSIKTIVTIGHHCFGVENKTNKGDK